MPAAPAVPECPAQACAGSVSCGTDHAAPAARTEPCLCPAPPWPAALGSPFTAKFLERAARPPTPGFSPLPLLGAEDVGVALPDGPAHSQHLTWWADDPFPLTQANDRGVPRPLSFAHIRSTWKPRPPAATPTGPHPCPDPTPLATRVALKPEVRSCGPSPSTGPRTAHGACPTP